MMQCIGEQSVCNAFQDLITGWDSIQVPTLDSNEIQDEAWKENEIPKQDAYSMTHTDLILELQRRQLTVKGFFSDDAKVLQATLDKEHEAYIETKKHEYIDANLEFESERLALMKSSVVEEEKEIAGNIRLAVCFEKILDQSSPLYCRIESLSDVSVRSLSKILWSDNRLTAVDVSNMQLSDVSGAYLGRALRNNTSLKKLELGGNRFASKCCIELAESLLANKDSNLALLGLESNPLCSGENSKASIELLARAIGKNTSLVSLSLWRCGIDIEGIRAFADAIVSGTSRLISLEIGYNECDSLDIVAIVKQLEINRANRALRQAKEAEAAEEQRRLSLQKSQEEEAKRRELEKINWLAQEQKLRAETRRLALEEQKLERHKEEQKQKQMDHIQKLEKARIEEFNNKKTKRKKGKIPKK